MKRFCIKTILFCTGLMAVIIAILTYMLKQKDPFTFSTHEVNIAQSIERLQTTPSPRIIIIGGSGCGFGFHSELLSEHFNRPIINTGTHASIGLKLYYEIFEDYFQAGDIVLLIPEYEQYTLKGFWGNDGPTQYRILYNNYPDALPLRNLAQIVSTYKYAFKYYDGIRQDTISGASPYSKYALNEYGDVTHWDQRVHQDDVSFRRIIDSRVNGHVIRFIAEKAWECEERGVLLLLFPPMYAQSSYDQNEAYIQDIDSRLQKEGIPFAVSPTHYHMDDSYFYDTEYHLTDTGAKIRTLQMIHELDSILSPE